MEICSNGWWITFATNKIIATQGFVLFIKGLNAWFESNNNFNYETIIVIWDNYAFHKSPATLIEYQDSGFNVILLPADNPDFAPIEMCFGLLKRNLRKISADKHCNLGSKDNLSHVAKSLSKITATTIRKFFRRLYSELKPHLAS